MKFLKAFLITAVYIILIELLWLWSHLLSDDFFFSNLANLYDTINDVIVLIASVLLFKYFHQTSTLEFKKTNLKFIILAVILGIGYVFFQALLNCIYYFDFTSDFYEYKFTLENLYTFTAISSVLIVPIYEELFFRNYIQRKLSKEYKPYVAIFFASLLFALIHLPFESLFLDFIDFSWHHAYIAFFGGCISGILFYKSKSIIPSILFHMFWNLTVFVV